MWRWQDVPSHKLREDDVLSIARAGFSFVVADGEHSLHSARLGREETAMFLRHGVTPIQRLPREARSEHGDALTLGCRGTMMPYASSLEEVVDYLQCIRYPDEENGFPGTTLSRGAYPVKRGDGSLILDVHELRESEESACQGFVQFETAELISDPEARFAALETMSALPPNTAIAFVGPFDAMMRSESFKWSAIQNDVVSLTEEAMELKDHVGRPIFGKKPEEVEEAMVMAIKQGVRLIACGQLVSELSYVGAQQAAAPFFRAFERCGFSRLSKVKSLIN